MHPNTPTYSEAPSENSIGFHNAPRHGRKGVDYTKYKTRLCRNFSMGVHCPFGDRCAFSHGEPEAQGARQEEGELPPPPSYTDSVQTEIALPPAYSSRFRHDPYSFTGVMFEYS